tara:strand:+ start:14265 stop:16568 length:2304 start_codon:yes stop_codon:yes gene_type:complete
MYKYILLLISLSVGQTLDDQYHSTSEIYDFLDSLNQLEELNDWYHLDTIGYSTQENIPILAVRISDNASVKEDEPRVLFIGQVHAEEILGVEIVIDLIKDLLFPDASISSHMNILKQYLDIWIIPTANPEGLNVVHDGLDLSFRKNKRDMSPEGPFPNNTFDYDPSIGNDIDGVDLNRNFSFNWAFGDTFLEPDNSDYASHYDYYKGEEPFSESEAVAIRDLALENDFVFSIVWHSSRSGNLSEKVFTSWKWEDAKESPDLDIMKSISDYFASLIETEDGTSTYLSVFSGSRNGKLHDWFYRETGCMQYLVECGTSNLQPEGLLILNTIERNKPAMIYLMDRAIGYYTDAAQITGNIYDAETNEPIEGAIVEVFEHSGSVLKPRKTNEFGRYRRILDVGTYTFSFKAEGYLDQNLSLVANNSSITERDVFMTPASSHQLNLKLVHQDDSNYIIGGTISNRFGVTEIEISTGNNYFDLFEDEYKIQFVMNDNNIPWEKALTIGSDTEINIPYQSGQLFSMNQPWSLENSQGDWYIENTILRTQESQYYDNRDTLNNIQWLESEAIDISGSNRAVVSISHRYETEWDFDPIEILILDLDNNVLGSKIFTGHKWDIPHTDLVSALTEDTFSNVKIRLEFTPDNSVNYRGWEIHSLVLYSTFDEYLEIKEVSANYTPKIPLRVSGLFPNPSRGNFQFDLLNFSGGSATINIFNLLGQRIFTNTLQELDKGKHSIQIDLNRENGLYTSSGVYFIRIETKNEQAVKKCIILKN